MSACLKGASAKVNRPDFDHASHFAPYQVGSKKMIAGTMADTYDVALTGSLFYKSAGPDLAAIEFTCLLSPMLEFKAIQFKARKAH